MLLSALIAGGKVVAIPPLTARARWWESRFFLIRCSRWLIAALRIPVLGIRGYVIAIE